MKCISRPCWHYVIFKGPLVVSFKLLLWILSSTYLSRWQQGMWLYRHFYLYTAISSKSNLPPFIYFRHPWHNSRHGATKEMGVGGVRSDPNRKYNVKCGARHTLHIPPGSNLGRYVPCLRKQQLIQKAGMTSSTRSPSFLQHPFSTYFFLYNRTTTCLLIR